MPKPTGGGRGGGPPDRSVAISKALSRLLRHAAQQDRVPIDSHGYVRLDHALGWPRLRSMQQPRVEAADLVEAVRSSDKGRFAAAPIPATIVHGTFYGAWDAILHSGGLKAMGRNHVHFSTGPPLDDVLAALSELKENHPF
ncbi:hypothetical protein DV738_g3446, partial [Chaetothyriales sp. CBS 135597]